MAVRATSSSLILPAPSSASHSYWKKWIISVWTFLMTYTFLSRFFKPSPSGMISIALRRTGYVGKDESHSFAASLKLSNGTPLRISPQDYICFVRVTSATTLQEVELPSSLFTQARMGNRLEFQQNGHLHVLNLDPDFDDHLKGVEAELKETRCEFLHKQDIPDDYHSWSHLVYLSPQTKRVTPLGAEPVDFGTLEPLTTYQPIRILYGDTHPKTGELILQLAACGRPTIDILIDRRHLHVHTYNPADLREMKEKGYEVVRTSGGDAFYSDWMIPERFDVTQISATLNDRGVLTIAIPPKQ